MGLGRDGGIQGRGSLCRFHRERGRVRILEAAELGLILGLKLLRQIQSGGNVILSRAIEGRLVVHVVARGLERAEGLRNIGGVSTLQS